MLLPLRFGLLAAGSGPELFQIPANPNSASIYAHPDLHLLHTCMLCAATLCILCAILCMLCAATLCVRVVEAPVGVGLHQPEVWALSLQSLSQNLPHILLARLLWVVDQKSCRLSVVCSACLVSNRLLLISSLISLERHYLPSKITFSQVLFLICFQFSEPE